MKGGESIMDQKPTLGRIVHYVSFGTPNGEYQPEHRAAVITKVIEKDDNGNDLQGKAVALCVMNPTGLFFNEVVLQDEEDKKGGTWHWPERV